MSGTSPAGGGQGRHVHRLAEQVHRQDRLGLAGDRPLHRLGVEVIGLRVAVDQHRPGAEPGHAARRREEREGRRDHLVAGADAGGHHRHQQRVGARRHAQGVAHLEVVGELALEGDDLVAHDAALAVADAGDDVEELLAQRTVLRLEVEEGDGFTHDRVYKGGRTGRRWSSRQWCRDAHDGARHRRPPSWQSAVRTTLRVTSRAPGEPASGRR